MSTKKKNKTKVPLRECVSCHQTFPKKEMIRIVVSLRGEEKEDISVDETGKEKGRGAYICKRKICIEDAFQNEMIDSDTKDMLMEGILRNALQMVSIAMKAGKVASGEFQTEESIKTGEASLVLIAGDASPGTTKKFTDKCSYYGVPVLILSDKDTLGRVIGKNERSVIALKDEQFSTKVLSIFGGNE